MSRWDTTIKKNTIMIMGGPMLSKKDAIKKYLMQSRFTQAQLDKAGIKVEPCDCGNPNCPGYWASADMKTHGK